MKNQSNASVLWQISIIIFLFVFIGFSQDSKQNQQDFHYQKYVTEIGQKLARSLSGSTNCSILRGKLTLNNDKQLIFEVEKQLFQFNEKYNRLLLNYKQTSKKFKDEFSSPWSMVDITTGNELILSYCGGESGLLEYAFVVSDTELFADIEKSIAHYVA